MDEIHAAPVATIRSWYRLHRALIAFGQEVKRDHGVSGEQLALLRILGERDSWELSDLRSRLSMHPATLGQSIDRLAERKLVGVGPSSADRRRRIVTLTPAGRALIAAVPLVGPVRLRSLKTDPERLERVREAFDDAVILFGVERWAS
jgi:DNA-binding MarR family transcriptional regulator